MLVLLSACGGGGSSGGGGAYGSSSGPGGPGGGAVPTAFTVYGAQCTNTNQNGIVLIDPVDTQGVVLSGAVTGPATGPCPEPLLGVTISGANYLYVANTNGDTNGNTISIYRVNGSSVTSLGAVTAPGAIGGAQMVFAGGSLFVPMTSGAISSWAVGGDGTLTLENAAAYTVSGGQPQAMSSDATRKYLIVSEYAGLTSWNALALAIGTEGTLSLDSEQTGILGSANFILPDPVLSSGNYLYASGEGFFYELSLSSGGTINVTDVSSSIAPTNETEPYPVWIDPTGTWLYLAEADFGTGAETLVQYRIDSSGTLSAGSEAPVQIASGTNGSFGGFTNSPGYYDPSSGIVALPIFGYLSTFSYGSDGNLAPLALRTGSIGVGFMAGF